MKPRNFPARKLRRQINAHNPHGEYTQEQQAALSEARRIRTKKNRSARA